MQLTVERVFKNTKRRAVLANNVWYGLNKVVPDMEVGKSYVVTVEENGNFKNIVDVLASSPDKVETIKQTNRNYDKENRGKTRCALLAALLSNPNVVTEVKDIKQFVNELVEFVFE